MHAYDEDIVEGLDSVDEGQQLVNHRVPNARVATRSAALPADGVELVEDDDVQLALVPLGLHLRLSSRGCRAAVRALLLFCVCLCLSLSVSVCLRLCRIAVSLPLSLCLCLSLSVSVRLCLYVSMSLCLSAVLSLLDAFAIRPCPMAVTMPISGV